MVRALLALLSSSVTSFYRRGRCKRDRTGDGPRGSGGKKSIEGKVKARCALEAEPAAWRRWQGEAKRLMWWAGGGGEEQRSHEKQRKRHWASVAVSTFLANQSVFTVTPPAQLIRPESSFGSGLRCFQFNNPR